LISLLYEDHLLNVGNGKMKRIHTMKIENALQKFYDYSIHIRGYSKATIKRYKYTIELYCRFAHIETTRDITSDNVRSLFFYGRSERKWKTSTYLVFYKSLKVFFRWCQQEKLITENHTDGIEKPKLEKKIPSNLTKQEAFRLLEIVDNFPYSSRFLRHRNTAMFTTLIYAGLRLNELLKLRYSDVDIPNLTLFVSQGKGNKDRIIPMSSTLAANLERYVQERLKTHKTCPEFFTSATKNCGFSEAGMKRLVLSVRAASGIRFTVHMLRHTFATLMLEGGCDIYSLSKMMGHSDIKTTTIYLSASVEHLRAQMVKHPMNERSQIF
jgi:site-specific recombinase XerD